MKQYIAKLLPLEEDGSKLRMFILKRKDAKIGEPFKFYSKGYEEEDIVDHFESILPLGVMVGKDEDNFIHLADIKMYETIGLMSTSVLWVCDEQEFDDDEIYRYGYSYGKETAWSPSAAQWDGWVDSEIVKIQCPMCKAFH